MDTISLQNTKTLEQVFTNELQQRKTLHQQRRQTLWFVFVVSSLLLAIYVMTPLFTIIA